MAGTSSSLQGPTNSSMSSANPLALTHTARRCREPSDQAAGRRGREGRGGEGRTGFMISPSMHQQLEWVANRGSTVGLAGEVRGGVGHCMKLEPMDTAP